jgi:uncharacterized membrane protein YqaE (UPF0057 family)
MKSRLAFLLPLFPLLLMGCGGVRLVPVDQTAGTYVPARTAPSPASGREMQALAPVQQRPQATELEAMAPQPVQKLPGASFPRPSAYRVASPGAAPPRVNFSQTGCKSEASALEATAEGPVATKSYIASRPSDQASPAKPSWWARAASYVTGLFNEPLSAMASELRPLLTDKQLITILVALLLAPLGVALYEESITQNFWINVLLFILSALLFGVVLDVFFFGINLIPFFHALYVILE